MDGRTAAYSSVTMAQVMQPSHANVAGNVHGGEVMMMMDNAAGVVACRHSRSITVTARVESIEFLQPIYVGNLVTIEARLTFVSKHSMEVGMDVVTEDLTTGIQIQALTAFFIMVALDEKGRPKEVPPLSVQTDEERRLFQDGLSRYEGRKRGSSI
ncbi:MAG: acyl-CoA thioesterase [Dehalococcoidia bacterium]|nr:acyl-CoA thioesterase [Dehalococcoidia bacterium]